MIEHIKQMWVTALRSGKYVQARGHLRNKHGHCCMGVLAEVLGCKWESKDGLSGDLNNWKVLVPIIDGSSDRPLDGVLTTSVLNRIGLADTNQRELTAMNDSGSSFGTIATWIEEML